MTAGRDDTHTPRENLDLLGEQCTMLAEERKGEE